MVHQNLTQCRLTLLSDTYKVLLIDCTQIGVRFKGEGVGEAGKSSRSDEWQADLEGKVRTSLYHGQYLSLYLDLGDRTVPTNHSNIKTISSAMKARTKLIDLNYY